MRKRDWLLRLLPVFPLALLLLLYPSEMTKGIRQGLTICGSAVIPSLFPFFVMCTFFVRSGLCDGLGRLASPVVTRLFHLPGSAAGAILLGMCGGYPVGTRMTWELYKSGSVNREQAQRLCLFCVAAGPAFMVGTVGGEMLHSRTCGWMLFASVTMSNILVALLLRFTGTAQKEQSFEVQRKPISRCICESVSEAGASMLPLCAWILLFSGICNVLVCLPQGVYVPLCSVLEVTNGCHVASDYGVGIPILAAILGFGGMSVHCQVLPYVTECGVKVSRYMAFRVAAGAVAAVFCSTLLRLFPQAVTTALLLEQQPMKVTSSTVPVSVALLFTAAVFILNTQPSKNHSMKKSRCL